MLQRHLFCSVLLLASAASLRADQTPDYSRDSVLRIVAPPAEEEKKLPILVEGGRVKMSAFGTNLLFSLPFSPMFSGSFNTGRGFGSSLPNPFVLTGTQLAIPPHLLRDLPKQPELSLDLGKSSRAKVKIRVD